MIVHGPTDLPEKYCKGQTVQLINRRKKLSFKVGSGWDQTQDFSFPLKLSTAVPPHWLACKEKSLVNFFLTRAQFYNSFYVLNLRIFVKS
jgi:hypothetical protein